MRTLTILLPSLLVLACGDDAPAGTGGAGGASTTSASTTSTSTTSTTTTTSTSSQGGGGAAPVCSDATSEGTTDVVLRNDTAGRLWFRIGPYHAPAPVFVVGGASEPTCPCESSNFCKSSGASTEGATQIGFLEPGTEFTLTWDERLYGDAAASCGFDSGACGACNTSTCQLAIAPEAGSYPVVATAYVDPVDPTGLDCDLATQDFCQISFEEVGVDLVMPVEATGMLAFPDDDAVVVAFTEEG